MDFDSYWMSEAPEPNISGEYIADFHIHCTDVPPSQSDINVTITHNISQFVIVNKDTNLIEIHYIEKGRCFNLGTYQRGK